LTRETEESEQIRHSSVDHILATHQPHLTWRNSMAIPYSQTGLDICTDKWTSQKLQ